MQDEITELTDILDDNGHIIKPGWARKALFNYEREKIKSGKMRIKEWDFWEVVNQDYRVVLNIFDIGFAGTAQFTFTDFNTGKSINGLKLKLFTKGSIGNPKSWKYDKPLVFKKGKSIMEFDRDGDNIILKIDFPKAMKGKGIKGEFSLYKDPNSDSIVNLIPFENKKHFVYAQKILCMPANGSIRMGDTTYDFSENNNSYGVLDWTRAVFPHSNQWKWCVGNGKVSGNTIGFNLDYGFGTESSKNMIFFNGKGHHLDEIQYEFDWKNLDAPLKITSNDNRVNLVLKPKMSEKLGVILIFVGMKGVTAYGYYTGELILDDGKKIEIKESDKFWGWAEEFFQKW